MEITHIVFLILIGIGAGFLNRVSGFGMGIFAMLFLPHFISSSVAAAAITSLFCTAISIYNGIRYRKNVQFKTVLPIVAAAMICIPIAVYFSKSVSGEIIRIILGAVLILLSLYFVFFSEKIKMKPTVSNGILSGSLGGVLSGLFSVGGPPVVLYISSATKDKFTYFATIQFYFCITDTYSAATRVVNGIITKEIVICAAITVLGCIIGAILGKRVFDKLDSQKIKKTVYILMLISGVLMLF